MASDRLPDGQTARVSSRAARDEGWQCGMAKGRWTTYDVLLIGGWVWMGRLGEGEKHHGHTAAGALKEKAKQAATYRFPQQPAPTCYSSTPSCPFAVFVQAAFLDAFLGDNSDHKSPESSAGTQTQV